MTRRDLLDKLNAEPFHPFRVRLADRTSIYVPSRYTVVVGIDRSVMPLETTRDRYGRHLVPRWRTVALAHMVEFIDIEPPKSQSRKRAS